MAVIRNCCSMTRGEPLLDFRWICLKGGEDWEMFGVGVGGDQSTMGG